MPPPKGGGERGHMDTNTKQFLLWVDSNEGMTYIAEKTVHKYEKEQGTINTDTALGFVRTVGNLIVDASVRHPSSDGAIMMREVNFATCELLPIAKWMEKFSGMQEVS